MKSNSCVIVEKMDGFHVLAQSGESLGGPYMNREEAERRVLQINFIKKLNRYDQK